MFTGLVEECGTVAEIRRRGNSVVFRLRGSKTMPQTKVNDSICVDGVCLTVVRKKGSIAEVQAVEETLRKTTLGTLKRGSLVNLERAMRADARLGGHFVLGHVDGVGRVADVEKRRNSWMIRIKAGSRFRKYLIPVGSIAVNGVSLTIAELHEDVFGVSIIPRTRAVTTMKGLKKGDAVNLEFDVLGKYVERLLAGSSRKRR